ncbi:MAG: hypothetical protein M3160_06245, partial [Candidatus Eremiobacteraeota bacterium]|nr:hypothetical protein [Candidatus Eremiobacteraeota bacterium]
MRNDRNSGVVCVRAGLSFGGSGVTGASSGGPGIIAVGGGGASNSPSLLIVATTGGVNLIRAVSNSGSSVMRLDD